MIPSRERCIGWKRLTAEGSEDHPGVALIQPGGFRYKQKEGGRFWLLKSARRVEPRSGIDTSLASGLQGIFFV